MLTKPHSVLLYVIVLSDFAIHYKEQLLNMNCIDSILALTFSERNNNLKIVNHHTICHISLGDNPGKFQDST